MQNGIKFPFWNMKSSMLVLPILNGIYQFLNNRRFIRITQSQDRVNSIVIRKANNLADLFPVHRSKPAAADSFFKSR